MTHLTKRLRHPGNISRFFQAFCLVGLSFLPQTSFAAGSIRALNEAAVRFTNPDKAALVAITRVGNRLVSVGEHGVIIYSDDNAKTWKQAKVPVSVLLTAVQFGSLTDGWAVGHYGVILHTKDAGATWQLQLAGPQINRLTMAEARAAIAGNNPSPGTALALKRADHFMEIGPSVPFLTVWVQNGQDAIAFGAYRIAMKTTDGGKTWMVWDLHIGDPLSHHLYDVVSVKQDLYIAAEMGFVFRSTDYGNSFVQLTRPNDATLFSVIGTGNGAVLVLGVAGEAFRSVDHGETWQQVMFGTAADLTSACSLSNGAIVVGSGDGTVYISHDHAETFKPLPELQPMPVNDLAEAANNDLIIVGTDGVRRVPAQELNRN